MNKLMYGLKKNMMLVLIAVGVGMFIEFKTNILEKRFGSRDEE